MRPRTTPGWEGYLAAVVIAIVLTDVGFVVSQGVALSPLDLVFGLIWGLFYVLVLALPSAPIGVLVAHLACRGIGDQRVHVAVAGLVGAAVGAAWLPVLAPVDGLRHPWLLPLVLAFACAVGRAAVIPRGPRVDEPVDDDSRRDVPAR